MDMCKWLCERYISRLTYDECMCLCNELLEFENSVDWTGCGKSEEDHLNCLVFDLIHYEHYFNYLKRNNKPHPCIKKRSE